MRIGLDMDGTIVDFTTASFKKVEELYGIKMTKEDAYKPKTAQLVWERMTNDQRAKYKDHRELYGEICADGFFLDLQPFPGAIEAVKKIADAGWEIVFITKVLNWERSAPEKALWLKKWLPDVDYHTIMVDSVHAKKAVNVHMVVDDDPRVLAKWAYPVRVMMRQPWNEKSRGLCEYEVDNMDEAASLAIQYKKDHREEWMSK